MQFLFFVFVFLENMLGKILGFGRMQQNIFFLFENVLNFFYMKYFGETRCILRPGLYFTV